MTHESAAARIDAYLDNELATSDALALIEHAKECAICREQLEASIAIRDRVKREMPSYKAPAEFKAKLNRELRKQTPSRWYAPRMGKARMFSIAGALAIGIFVGVLVDSKLINSPPSTSALFDSHINSLRTGHLIDVASSDKHTVKPWFAGKIDFSPFVIDLAQSGFPLLGGRAEHIDGHDAAALVYTKGRHYITLYEWPLTTSAINESKEERGYNTIYFTQSNMQCVIISDASMQELTTLRSELTK